MPREHRTGYQEADPEKVHKRGKDQDSFGRTQRRSWNSRVLQEGINPNVYYKGSRDFLEAGKKRLHGDTEREATSTEIVDLKMFN